MTTEPTYELLVKACADPNLPGGGSGKLTAGYIAASEPGAALLARADAADAAQQSEARLRGLLLEMVGDYHQTGLIRDHADPGAKGWDVNKDWRICEDQLCAAARAALAPASPVAETER